MKSLKNIFLLLAVILSISCIVSAAEMDSYDGGWVGISVIQPGVYRFEENYANSYLVIGQTQAVLIDAGYGVSNLQKLCAELTPLPVSVINTHGHVDHVGSDQYFAKVYIHKTDAPLIEHGLNFWSRQWALGEFKKNPMLPKDFNPSKWNYPPVKPAQRLEGGETLNFGDDIRMEVIWTPGHTPGSISLLDRERGLLLSGDTFVPGEMWMQLPESNYKDWVDSAEKLANLKSAVRTVLPGHGAPCDADYLVSLGEAVTEIRNGTADDFPATGPSGKCRKAVFPLFAVFHN